MKFYTIPKRRWKKHYDKILEWRRNNPEKISKYNQEYYRKNKDRLREKRKEKGATA